MNYSYIVNPLTNRKCDIHSRTGQNILNQYLIQDGGACSICGAEGVTKVTCPQNPSAKNPKPEKHKVKGREPPKPVEPVKRVEAVKSSTETTRETVKPMSEFEKTTLLKVIKGPAYSFYLPGMKLKGESGPGRNFLLLGEYHTNVPDCDHVAQGLGCFNKWIHYVAKNSPYCLDFFLEGTSYSFDADNFMERTLKPKRVIDYQNGGGMIDMIREYFEKNDIRRFKNTRMHSVDLRIINQTTNQGKTSLPQSHKYTQIYQSFFALGYKRDTVDKKFHREKSPFLNAIEEYIDYLINIPKEHLTTIFDNIARILQQPVNVKHYITLLKELKDKLEGYTPLDKYYSVLDDLLIPDEPRYFNTSVFEKNDLTIGQILDSKIKGIILGRIIFVGFVSYAEELKTQDKINSLYKEITTKTFDLANHIIEYRFFLQDTMYSYNEQISYYKNVIERQLGKSLLEKNDFIKNKDIWFARDGINTPNLMNNLRPHSFLMDVYTLSRMFGVFEESKLNRGPLECRDPIYKTPRNIIFYGGQGHSIRYSQFINRLNKGKNKSTVIATVDMAQAKQCDLSNMINCKHIDYTLKKEHKDGFNFFENVI